MYPFENGNTIQCRNPVQYPIQINSMKIVDNISYPFTINFMELVNISQTGFALYKEKSDRNLRTLDNSYEIISVDEFFPAIYFIEPTNTCNINCIMCPNSKLNNKSFMDINLFMKIIDEIKHVAKLIRLHYRGEPLLHPKIIEMIKYCKSHTLAKISMSTNGLLLDQKLSERLIEAGIDEIIFSLDSNSPESYYKIKNSKEFHKVVKNITDFLSINSNNKVRVIIKFIEMDINKNEMEFFKNRWSSYNCETKISWMNTWANQLQHNKSISEHLCPNSGKPKMKCADLWYKMVITADGYVPLCCNDFSIKHQLGNINNSSVKEIWNSNNLKSCRKMHNDGTLQQLNMCQNCNEFSKKQDVYEYLDIKNFPVGRP